MEVEQFIALAHSFLSQTTLSLRHCPVFLQCSSIKLHKISTLSVLATEVFLIPRTMPGPENNCGY